MFLPSTFAEGASPESMVRLVYFLPSDRPDRPERVKALRQLIKDAQQYFADEMERHGYGRKTFTLETNKNDEPVVHRIKGRFKEDYYYEPLTDYKVWAELFEHFESTDFQHAYLIALDLSHEELDDGNSCGLGGVSFMPSGEITPAFLFKTASGSVATRHRDITQEQEILGGLAIIPASGDCFYDTRGSSHPLRITTHELGHAFGLTHDFREGFDNEAGIGGRGFQLSKCEAEWLSVSRFFTTKPKSRNQPAKIQMLSTRTYNKDTISLRFKVTDPDGLHQSQLLVPHILNGTGWGPYRLFDCKRLNGKTGIIESYIRTIEIVDRVTLQVIDVNGNITWATLPIELNEAVSAQNFLDVNGDGTVNLSDLIPIASRFGRRGKAPADINEDGVSILSMCSWLPEAYLLCLSKSLGPSKQQRLEGG